MTTIRSGLIISYSKTEFGCFHEDCLEQEYFHMFKQLNGLLNIYFKSGHTDNITDLNVKLQEFLLNTYQLYVIIFVGLKINSDGNLTINNNILTAEDIIKHNMNQYPLLIIVISENSNKFLETLNKKLNLHNTAIQCLESINQFDTFVKRQTNVNLRCNNTNKYYINDSLKFIFIMI